MESFGTAIITAPIRKRNRGRKFDCGHHGKLSAAEIAKIAGMSREGVWQRVQKGWKGSDLCKPKHESLRRVKERCSRPVMTVAMKLARTFPDKVPTVKEIQAVHPMCARNAMRWRQAMADNRVAA